MTKQAALKSAIIRENFNVFKTLLNDPSVDPSKDNNFYICYAAFEGLFDFIELLLQDERVNPSDKKNYAISSAFIYGHIDIVNLLWNDSRVQETLENDRPQLYNTLKIKNNLDTF